MEAGNEPLSIDNAHAELLQMPEARLAIVASSEEPNGTGLLLEPNENPIARAFQEGVYQLNMPVIVFGVDDIYKVYERMEDLGVVFRREPTKTGQGIETVFEDTCGNLIQLFQAGAEA